MRHFVANHCQVYFEIDENNIEQWEKPQIKESKRAFFYATITEVKQFIIFLLFYVKLIDL